MPLHEYHEARRLIEDRLPLSQSQRGWLLSATTCSSHVRGDLELPAADRSRLAVHQCDQGDVHPPQFTSNPG
jgi:hypothetical protein